MVEVSVNRKVLICHDIPAGIHESDQTAYHSKWQSAYRFTHWQHIDYFVFFGHNRVTIPPEAYIH